MDPFPTGIPIDLQSLRRVRERKLGQWAIAYGAAGWLALQILDLVGEHFGWPSAVLRGAIIVVAAGFLVTLVLVWYHGEQGRQRATGAELILIAGLLGATALALALVTRGGEDEPVHVAAADLDPQRVAVLPFRNLNPSDTDGEMFAAGVHDDLLTRLSRIGALTVVSRTSVMEYADSTRNIQTIARQLSAGTILEGGVQRAGNDVRINVQLIDGRDDRHLWAETFTRSWSLDNLFAIQTEIAEAVAAALSATLNTAERASIAARPTRSEEAYARYVEMRSIWTEQLREGLPQIVALGEEALSYDPDFVAVHALISWAHSLMYWQRNDRSPERLRLAREAADAALALDPHDPDALTAMALYHYWGLLEYDRAEVMARRALESEPRHDQAMLALGAVLRRQGRVAESLPYFERAAAIAPRDVFALRALGDSYDMLRRCSDADSVLRAIADVGPMGWEDRLFLADHYIACGELDQARDQAGLAVIGSSSNAEAIGIAARIELIGRQPRRALELLAETSAQEVSQEPQMHSWPRALLEGDAYAQLGIADSARAKYRDAVRQLEAGIAETPDDERLWGALGRAWAGLGEEQEAVRAGLRATELLPIEREAWRGAHRVEELARTYARVGEHERAIDALEQLMSRPVGLVLSHAHLQMDPAWDALRELPRFQQLLN